MSTILKRKRSDFAKEIESTGKEEEDLFVDVPMDEDDDDSDGDDSDLEDDSDDEQLEEEMTDSEEGAVSSGESQDSEENGDSAGDGGDDVGEEDRSDGDDEDDVAEQETSKPKSRGKLARLTWQLRPRRSHLQSSVKLDNETAPSQLTPADDNSGESGAGTSTGKEVDEYEFDSSDEEDIRNTVGNIPMEWYDDYPHIGYDVRGQMILRPPKRDELEEFLEKMDNPDYWRTVHDKMTGRDIVLPDEDVAFIQRIQDGRYPETTFDPYEPWIDFFTQEKMIHPVTRRPEHKRSFIPSLLEKEKVSKMLHSIRMGWMKPRQEKKKDEDDRPKFYDIWSNESQVELTRRHHAHIAAPKERLPGHEESYRPPPEYLPTEEEIKEWKEAHPEDRKMDFLPQTFDCFRKVPAYRDYVRERFERCLDLYLCPRQRKMRVQVQPEDLLPKLPKPKDLQPFPTTQAVVYLGHRSYVRTISVDPTGQWLVSGSDDETVRFWEVSSGRCMKKLDMEGTVRCVAWCPNPAVCLVAVSVEQRVHLVNPGLGDKLVVSDTDRLLEAYEEPEEAKTSPLVEWSEAPEEAKEKGFRLCLKHFKTKQIAWHGKGDYFGTVVPDGGHSSVLIHQLSKRRSQTPFKKSKGLVQTISFHPSRPYFFVATQRFVRVYNLLKQELTKKLLTTAKWISSIAIHPGGDNVLVGSYDCRLSWFDMDLSVKPYKTLRHHRQAIRHVCYHRRYPLFASSGDDGLVIVCHGQVYNDLLQNAQIVPVKILRGHEVTNSLGVLACEFHPSQPWLFSSGADGTVRLFT
ncbi:ribosome biogenesis protein bop1-A-like isoform X2 [Acanthaster planci]|uniref:Ribosome biogenesis protein BOP1 homolog n=1 Tax=Acanthaster planci TaxID=133434 RepID=A0A8B7XQY6_ACAPL|nr:ribosome biogenesis protein bop1-A-like isoform X2 [Acanthaster planci]